MSEFGVVGLEAVHVGFALLARKLILCGELIAVFAIIGWRLDARAGLPLWAPAERASARLGELCAAATTVSIALYVAFVRDLSELGAHPAFSRYGALCLAVLFACSLGGALLSSRGFDLVGVLELVALSTLGILGLQAGVLTFAPVLEPIGRLFGVREAEYALHGLASVMTAAGGLILGVRVWNGAGPTHSPWDAALTCALLALCQGFLAFRGVSALYILAGAAVLAWRAGWRVTLLRRMDGFEARVVRRPRAETSTQCLPPSKAA
jgi:hypothetical protein